MKHITDIYRTQISNKEKREISIYSTDSGFICDVKDMDGNLVAGWDCLKSYNVAIMQGTNFCLTN